MSASSLRLFSCRSGTQDAWSVDHQALKLHTRPLVEQSYPDVLGAAERFSFCVEASNTQAEVALLRGVVLPAETNTRRFAVGRSGLRECAAEDNGVGWSVRQGGRPSERLPPFGNVGRARPRAPRPAHQPPGSSATPPLPIADRSSVPPASRECNISSRSRDGAIGGRMIAACA